MLYTFGVLTPTTAVILLILALIIFGPGKLPEIGKSLGRGIKEFKSATTDDEKPVSESTNKIEAAKTDSNKNE